MSDANDIAAAFLDAARTWGVGANSELRLLAVGDPRGYRDILGAPVSGGWTIEDSELSGYQLMCIVESDQVTREVLRATRSFSVDGTVYNIVGAYKVEAPAPNSMVLQWKWQVQPSGEVFVAS